MIPFYVVTCGFHIISNSRWWMVNLRFVSATSHITSSFVWFTYILASSVLPMSFVIGKSRVITLVCFYNVRYPGCQVFSREQRTETGYLASLREPARAARVQSGFIRRSCWTLINSIRLHEINHSRRASLTVITWTYTWRLDTILVEPDRSALVWIHGFCGTKSTLHSR